MIPGKHAKEHREMMPGHPVYDTSDELSVDYDEFRQTFYCEKCHHEVCCCPRYVPSQTGSILWMDGDMGVMIVSLTDDVNPGRHIGQCYSAVDSDNKKEYVYQLVEYMSGPPHECMFQVKMVGESSSLSVAGQRRYRHTPRLEHLRK